MVSFSPPNVKDTVFLSGRGSSKSAAVSNVSEPKASSKPKVRTKQRYEALKGDHCIRLLTLHPASNKNDEILCTLTVHNFDDAIPKFTALSYTWGSKKNPKSIRLTNNGFKFSITQNLHVGLMHLRSAERDIILWIDALCIDQGSKQERSHQVSLMRDIYMVAEDVLAWLGPATDGIDPNDQSANYTDIVSRTYWTRVWIIQELVLGKKVTLQRGHVRHDWDNFYAEFPEDLTQGGQHMRRLFDLKRRYKTLSRGLDIAEAITLALNSEATDPRDKVYGVLGLVERHFPSSVDAVVPDYNLSPCQVYRRAIVHINDITSLRSRYTLVLQPTDCNIGKCNGQKCGSLERLMYIVSMAPQFTRYLSTASLT